MKFKFKPNKSNLFLMSSTILLLIFVCLLWLVLREYIYFAVYGVLTLIISYTYYFTSYYIKDRYLETRLGFIFIRIKYRNIKKVELVNDKVRIHLKNVKFNICPNNKDIFVVKLNSKLTNKNSHNIMK